MKALRQRLRRIEQRVNARDADTREHAEARRVCAEVLDSIDPQAAERVRRDPSWRPGPLVDISELAKSAQVALDARRGGSKSG